MQDILKVSKYVFHCTFMRVYMWHVFPSSSDDSDESDQGAGAGHGAEEGSGESRPWRSVVIGEQEHRIDMKSIEPYKRVISHGGSRTHFIPLSFIKYRLAGVHWPGVSAKSHQSLCVFLHNGTLSVLHIICVHKADNQLFDFGHKLNC